MNIDQANPTPDSAFASLRMAARLAAMVLASIVMMPVQWLLMRVTRGRASFVLPRIWFGFMRSAMSLRLELVGTPRDAGGTLFVGNHISHFDIVLLGSVLCARFIAKNDMEQWPGMQFIGELAQTLYISRRARDAASVAASIASQMRQDHDLVLFAEGTTSPGERVGPFKSSLFAPFLVEPAAQTWKLQPFTLDILSFDGRPLSASGNRDGYAFHGGMDAGSHVKRFLRSSGALVRITFHAPIDIVPGMDRKALALRVHDIVESGLPSSAKINTPPQDSHS